jgi:hypothetical protein
MIRALLLLLYPATLFAQDLLVLAPEEFQPALKAWRAHREKQGHTVAVRAPEQDPVAQVRRVHKAAGGALKYVLLLGDVKRIACTYSPGESIKLWERDPRIANDNQLADLDGDGLPDLAVGRLPADDLAEATAMIGKIVAYEKNRDFSTWRRRLNMVAGIGGFGMWADWALEQATIAVARDVVPPAYDVHATYANPRSSFCPPPARVAETTLERLNEGALVVAYFGHGSRRRLDRLRFRAESFDIFTEDHAYELKARRGAPIVFFCACSTGHMDGAPDSLAELVIKQPAGPVAVYAATRVSMPYANGMFSKELIQAILSAETVGAALKEAKRRMMADDQWDKTRRTIETYGFAYKTAEERRSERAEHLYLYNLFGDPSMRIPRAARVEVLVGPEEIAPGGRLKIVGRTNVAGEVLVELVAERTTVVPQRVGDDDAAFAETYARANARTRASAKTTVDQGRFAVELGVPEAVNTGRYYVRVYVTGAGGAAMGAYLIEVKE